MACSQGEEIIVSGLSQTIDLANQDGASDADADDSAEDTVPADDAAPVNLGNPANVGNPGHSGNPGNPANPGAPIANSPARPTEAEAARADLQACAEALGKSPRDIKLAGNQAELSIQIEQAALVRVTGNQSRLNLRIKSSSGLPVDGLCVSVGGNRAEVKIRIEADIKNVYYVGRGNSSQGEIEVKEDAGILGAFKADLAGNQSQLNVFGAGVFKCPQVRIRGGESKVACSRSDAAEIATR